MAQDQCESLKSFIETGLTKEELFDLIVRNFPVGLIIIDKEELILEFNPAAERITGFSKEEVCGQHCHEVLTGLPCHLAEMESCLNPADGDFVHREGTIMHKDGHEIPVMYTAAPLFKGSELMGAVTIFRDISNEKRLEKHRQVVISMFAHDLKGPLSVAGAFLKRLLDGKAGPLNEKQRLYTETVLNEIARVERYVHAFLDILRMEAGQIPLSKRPHDVKALIADIVNSVMVKAQEKQISIVQEIDPDLPPLEVDRDQLQRVLINLLDNAIKYSPSGARIRILVKDKGKYVLFQVEDQGPGIAKDDLPYIFDPFYRAHQEEKIEGSGLGLAVVKSIVEAHGGKVWVKNRTGTATGAVFSFTIPKRP